MNGRDFSHIRSHRFRGKRYELIWRLPKKTGTCANCGQMTRGNLSDGECDPPVNVKKAIRIGPNLPELTLLETAIHESLHGCLWDLEEEAISDTARDSALLLWRMGFRLVLKT